MAYSGNGKSGWNGVAVYIWKEWNSTSLGYNPINDRLLSVCISGKPTNITIIQTYAPTSQSDDEEVEEFYEKLAEAIDCTPERPSYNSW